MMLRVGCRILRPLQSQCSTVPGVLSRRQKSYSTAFFFSSKPFVTAQSATKDTVLHRQCHYARAGRVRAGFNSSAVGPGVSRSLSSGARAARAGGGQRGNLKDSNRKVAIYMTSVVAAVLGVSYAAVPLYKVFCQVTGFGGTTQRADAEKAQKMVPVEGARLIRVTFDGGCADTMPWEFTPTQGDVKVVPGETALAFFTAKNPTEKHITGVATYNVFPLKAGIYFNKIQCFCFEEQRLRAGEEIDMPVFFFLDPEMMDDPSMDNVNNITLSYTFFQTAEEIPEDEEGDDEVTPDVLPDKVGSLAIGR